jgi:hypothetical protein
MPAQKADEASASPPQTPSFKNDILPLFRPVDISHMQPMGVLLDDYTYMSTPANAQTVYSYLTGDSQPQMPMGGPFWTAAQLQLFNSWMTTGYNP